MSTARCRSAISTAPWTGTCPDDEATTIAGLVIHEARSIPEPGQSFTFHGFRFSVLRKNRNRITALRITPLGREGAAEELARRAGFGPSREQSDQLASAAIRVALVRRWASARRRGVDRERVHARRQARSPAPR